MEYIDLRNNIISKKISYKECGVSPFVSGARPFKGRRGGRGGLGARKMLALSVNKLIGKEDVGGDEHYYIVKRGGMREVDERGG